MYFELAKLSRDNHSFMILIMFILFTAVSLCFPISFMVTWRVDTVYIKTVIPNAFPVTQAEASVAVEEMSSTKQKLISRINELKEEVARESSLRASLEVSHGTLMSRVQETEAIVQKERQEVCFCHWSDWFHIDNKKTLMFAVACNDVHKTEIMRTALNNY